MQTSQVGIELIKKFESCDLKAYKKDDGIWTIGWGHTGADVFEGDVISQDEADHLFAIDLHVKAENPIYSYLKVPVLQNQFDALACLTYNIGGGNLKTSTVLKLINDGDINGAAIAWTASETIFNKIHGIPSVGLTNRRLAEQKLFMGD